MKVPLTPLDFIERARRLYAPLEAVVDGDRRLTYGELADRCHRVGHGLRALGVRPGDRVAYLCPNTVELLEAYYGVLLAGAVLVPLNIRLSPVELQQIVDDAEPAVLVRHPSLAGLGGGLAGPRHVEVGPDYEALLASAPTGPCDPGPVDEDAVCEIFFTSGSTAAPKGAMLTHRGLATHALDSALTLGIGHRDVVLHTIPLFHVNGWGTPHYVTLLGGRHVMLERFEPARVLALVEAEGVTRLSLVPTMARALLDEPTRHDLSSVVQVTVGGAPPPPGMLAALEERFGCEAVCGYGLTEAAPQLTKGLTLRSHDGLPVEQQRGRRATTGLPNVGVDLRVLDDADAEVPRDATTVGEICVRSNHVMAGYWRRPAETEAALRGGWLRTGDLATVDAEGYVSIVDRRKDLVISGGENVSTVQVEAVLSEHPAVREVAVVGVPHPRWDEVPMAFLSLRPGTTLGADELVAWARERLAGFKVPRRVAVLDDLPKGGTGKIQKEVLRAMAASGDEGTDGGGAT